MMELNIKKKEKKRKITIRVPSESIFVALPVDFDIQPDRNQILRRWPLNFNFSRVS